MQASSKLCGSEDKSIPSSAPTHQLVFSTGCISCIWLVFDGRFRIQALAAEINNTGAATSGKPAFRPLMPRSLRGGKAESSVNGAAKRPRGTEGEAARDDGTGPKGRCSKAVVPGGGGGKRAKGAAETEDGATDKFVKGAAGTVDASAAVVATAAAAAGVVADAADAKVLSGCTVSFRHEDFVAEAHGDRGYDVICLFSVVKWMHINGGDEAVREVFRKVYGLLSPGGRLILEPQVNRLSTRAAHDVIFGWTCGRDAVLRS